MYVATVLEPRPILEPLTREDFIPGASDPSAEQRPDEAVSVFMAGEPGAVDARHR